jgi:hypothetical protein
MPVIITSVHDAVALAATCRRLGLRPPEEGRVELDGLEASGWVVRLPGLYAAVVFDTLTGRAAYHPRDNAFAPYGRIMRFIRRYYDVRATLRRGDRLAVCRQDVPKRRRWLPAGEVA